MWRSSIYRLGLSAPKNHVRGFQFNKLHLCPNYNVCSSKAVHSTQQHERHSGSCARASAPQSSVSPASAIAASEVAEAADVRGTESLEVGMTSSPSAGLQIAEEEDLYCVVNFYHLAHIEQPFSILGDHRDWLNGKDILGRIYITKQGINAQFSGPTRHAHAYAEWVSQQAHFQNLRWSTDPVREHQFPRLRLKYRENLVQLAGGTTGLPLCNPEARATPVDPADWKRMLQSANATESSEDSHLGAAMAQDQAKPVILDVRNSYEWDGGHFVGAERPAETQFNQTPTESLPGPLIGVAKDTPIMMYCTGGIRCDVYSPVLRDKGFTNLYTLHGGIANYLREIGPDQWKGSMFTFDNRLALAPDGKALSEKSLKAASPCKCCGGDAELPHLNCANIDCNRLFLACSSCQNQLRGCCSADCLNAPRMLRPQTSKGHYGPWHTLLDASEREAVTRAMQTGRGPTRLAKRQRRAERLKGKYELLRQQKAERKAMVAAALEQLQSDQNSELEDASIPQEALACN